MSKLVPLFTPLSKYQHENLIINFDGRRDYPRGIEKVTLLSLNNKKSWHDHGVDERRAYKGKQKNERLVLAKPARYLWRPFARCEAASVQALFTIYLSRRCHSTLSRWRIAQSYLPVPSVLSLVLLEFYAKSWLRCLDGLFVGSCSIQNLRVSFELSLIFRLAGAFMKKLKWDYSPSTINFNLVQDGIKLFGKTYLWTNSIIYNFCIIYY